MKCVAELTNFRPAYFALWYTRRGDFSATRDGWWPQWAVSGRCGDSRLTEGSREGDLHGMTSPCILDQPSSDTALGREEGAVR